MALLRRFLRVEATEHTQIRGSPRLQNRQSLKFEVSLCKAHPIIIRKKMLTKIDHKLPYLEARDPLFPRHPNSARALEIVPVHDDMDRQVEGDRNP